MISYIHYTNKGRNQISLVNFKEDLKKKDFTTNPAPLQPHNLYTNKLLDTHLGLYFYPNLPKKDFHFTNNNIYIHPLNKKKQNSLPLDFIPKEFS